MDMQIDNEREDKMFGRKEIWASTTYTGSTPSREEIKQEVCKKLGLNPDLTLVIKVSQAYGAHSSEIKIHSYSSKEVMDRLMRKPKEAAAKPAATPAPAKKEEAKTEEKK